MEWATLYLAFAGLLIAGIVKGATGLGYTTCALPFLVSAIGLKPAMALVIMPAMATNVGMAISGNHVLETLRRFKILYLAMLPGICAGVAILLWINQALAVHTLALAIIAYALLALFKPHFLLPAALEHPLQFPAGFLNGVMTGVTGAQVIPLFPYMMALNLDPDRMVQAINVAVLISSVALAITLSAAGVMTGSLFMASLLAIVPALLGVEIGTRARRLLSPAEFKRIALFTLLLMGVLMSFR
jgi:uncharacterized protein